MQIKNHKIEFFVTTDDLIKLVGEKEGYDVRNLLVITDKFQKQNAKEKENGHYESVVSNTEGGVMVSITYTEVTPPTTKPLNTIKAKP